MSGGAESSIADKILNGIFNKTGRSDLLQLSSMSACSRYVFAYAKEAATQFETVNLFPQTDAAGQVMVGSVDKLAPGLLKAPSGAAASTDAEVIKRRDKICMDVGYNYVRIFQIYAALAMSVLAANPYRSAQPLRGGERSNQAGERSNQQPLRGGAAFPKEGTASVKKMADDFAKSPFSPLDSLLKHKVRDELHILSMPVYGTHAFEIVWELPLPTGFEKSLKMKCLYDERVEAVIQCTRTSDNTIQLLINDEVIQEFVKPLSIGSWKFRTEDNTFADIADSKAKQAFLSALRTYFEGQAPTVGTTGTSWSSSSGAAGAAGTTAAIQGKSSYERFDELKKVFHDRYDRKGEFPKAFAVGRAMTLLTPIFENERRDKTQPFRSQVCKKVVDFETVAYMPRPGTSPKANIYFNSLVSLYYDTYELKGTTVSFSQSPQGNQELRAASKLFAALYGVSDKQEEFIQSTSMFKDFPVCTKKDAMLLLSNPALYNLLMKESVGPLLKLQEEHTKKVNAFLQQMFTITPTTDGLKLGYTPKLRGGIPAVNAFGVAARQLLLDYYLKAEALYIHGTMLIEQNPGAFTAY